MAISSSQNKSSNSTQKKSNQNYSANLAKGGSVRVKDGVKTYSDKSLQITGKGGISISGKDYSKNKGGTGFDPNSKVITAEGLKDTTAVVVPAVTVPQVGDYTANNAGLTGGETGVSQKGNTLVVDPLTDTSSTIQDNNFAKYLKDLQGTSAPTGADVQRKLEKETGIKQARQQVSDYSAQLNTITANRDANILKLEGQGRGVVDTIIGGQQAQVNKEAAIQALPVQAQLAAAQGNLQLAQDHINTWGQILMQDATNQYNRKVALTTAIYNYATDKEKTRITDIKAANERKYQENQALVAAKANALKQALSQPGGSAVMSAIRAATTLDEVVSATGKFNGDLLAQEAQRMNIAQSAAAIRASNATYAAALEANKPIVVQNNPNFSSIQNNKTALTELFRSNKVSAANRASIGNGLSLSQAATDLATASSDGKFKGLYPGRKIVDFFTPNFMKRPATVQNESLISALDLQTQFWASGAALSDAQTELVQKMIPTKSDSDTTIRTKTNQLVNYMQSQTSSRLLTDGIEYQPLKVDLFETQTLASKASPAQLQILESEGLIKR